MQIDDGLQVVWRGKPEMLEGERILQAKTSDGEQTKMQPQDETDETNDMLSVLG
jgi:hypothetical protein